MIKHQSPMSKRKFGIGDKVKVIGLSTANYPPGVKDELGTEKLFKSMVGKVYMIRGFDKYGHVKLQPTRRDTVWIERKFLRLCSKKTRNLKQQRLKASYR